MDRYRASIEVFETGVSTDLIARARALAARGRALGELGDTAGARASLTAAMGIFAKRTLGEDDPEAQVVARWLARYAAAG